MLSALFYCYFHHPTLSRGQAPDMKNSENKYSFECRNSLIKIAFSIHLIRGIDVISDDYSEELRTKSEELWNRLVAKQILRWIPACAGMTVDAGDGKISD